jgi:putative PEP-CTERM system histidine kinase
MRIQPFIRRFPCRSKYDYRDLWIRFSEISTGSPEIHDVLPKIAKFIARAMSIRQVVFWARSQSADNFEFVYATEPPANGSVSTLRLDRAASNPGNVILCLRKDSLPVHNSPIRHLKPLYDLGIDRVLPIQRGNELLGFLGLSDDEPDGNWSLEDEQFVLSLSRHISHLILAHELSQELLIAKEWESFNQCASFVLHDLKNLATVQSMTLENATNLHENLNFVADAFATFNHTTEQMIDLIASLSVRRGEFSLKQQPINILEVIRHTFDELKLDERNGLSIRTKFLPIESVSAIRGDPDLLRKAFTNVILNAIQSLPSGKGKVDVTVSQDDEDTITTSIRDTGCGIPPDRLASMFRPFESNKKNGLGIGLCQTRSIIEVHGGEIRIKSKLNDGTTVEIDLPASTRDKRNDKSETASR